MSCLAASTRRDSESDSSWAVFSSVAAISALIPSSTGSPQGLTSRTS